MVISFCSPAIHAGGAPFLIVRNQIEVPVELGAIIIDRSIAATSFRGFTLRSGRITVGISYGSRCMSLPQPDGWP